MDDLEVAVDWVGGGDGDPVSAATFGALAVVAGGTPLTEVEDTIARTTRPHVYVPASAVAEWLLSSWWRLRWEGRRPSLSRDWKRAHSMAAIGRGYAWPALEVSSDGEFVQLSMAAEPKADVSAIRYLRQATIDIPAARFESAIDRFVDRVVGRLASVLPGEQTIAELQAELREERARPSVARQCKWQALAGIDPGDASEAWLEAAAELASEAGPAASDELFAAAPPTLDGLAQARGALEAMKASTSTIDLRWVQPTGVGRVEGELPWQRGARAATELRRDHGLGLGPLADEALGDLLSVKLPLSGATSKNARVFGGGFRNGVTNGRTAILLASRRAESQRFALARMIGCASAVPAAQHVLPVTDGSTALQKFERSFAQELLCPWSALDAFTDETGLDDESIVDAAEHFQVSEWLVRSTLVNRGKLSREHLR